MELRNLQHNEMPLNTEDNQREIESKGFDDFLSSLEGSGNLAEIHGLIDSFAQINPVFRKDFKNFQDTNSEKLTRTLSRVSETPINLEYSRKLQGLTSKIHQLNETLSNIQTSLNESTSLSLKIMDMTKGLFTDDTVYNTYKNSFENTKSQATKLLLEIQKEFNGKSLSSSQKTTYDGLLNELNKITNLELASTGIVQMEINDIRNMPENMKSAYFGLKGEVIGIGNGFEGMIIGSFELLKFVGKYVLSEEYREEISIQTEKISAFCKENGFTGIKDKVFEVLGMEMDRISRLPPEEQSEAIGKIAGNVISMLLVIKGASMIGKSFKKIGQAEGAILEAEMAGNIARAEKVREIAKVILASKRGLQAFDILLTGVAESILLKGLTMSYKGVLTGLGGKLSQMEKYQLLDKTIHEIENLKSELPEEDLIKEKFISELNREKNKTGIKIIDRKNLMEDIPREDLKLQKITKFNELNTEQISSVDTLLQEVIGETKYNSFEKLEKLFVQNSKEKTFNPNTTLLETFQKMNLGKINQKEGSNCVGMSYLLQEKLKAKGVESYLIRFDAGGLINNNYVENGHSAVIIPLITNGKKQFILADPGLLISQSIRFEDGRNSGIFEIGGKNYIIKQEGKKELPYMVEVSSKKSQKKLYFDPYNEWLNPNETLNKDIMRAMADFKIVKQDKLGVPQTFYKFDIQKSLVTLKSGDRKMDITFEDFLKLRENKEKYTLFLGITKDLGINGKDFFKTNSNIIRHIDEYKNQIWAPSTRKILETN